VALGEAARPAAHVLARDLRRAGVATLVDYDARSLRAQMKRADRSGARRVLILGDDELARGEVSVREMESGEQVAVARDDVVRRLSEDEPEVVPPHRPNRLAARGETPRRTETGGAPG